MKQVNLIAIIWIITISSVSCDVARNTPAQPVEPRQPVEIRAFLDKAVATTGDQISYTVEIDRQKDLTVKIPEPGANIAGLRIVDSNLQPSESEEDRIIERRIYTLRADLVGSYVLPEVQVEYLPLTGGKQPVEPVTVSTSRIFLEVKSVLPKDGSANDIRGLKSLKQPDLGVPWWIWVIFSVVLTGLGTFMFWWIRRRHRVATGLPERPPHEIAFESLDALRSMEFDDPETVHRYYFLISEIVRQYTERRFSLNATDLTTNEILDRSSDLRELGENEHRLLGDFLVHTDLVKFADLRPDDSQIESCYNQAVQFVESTIPEPQEELIAQNDRRVA